MWDRQECPSHTDLPWDLEPLLVGWGTGAAMAPFGQSVAERRVKSRRSVGLSQKCTVGLLMLLRIFASTPLIVDRSWNFP